MAYRDEKTYGSSNNHGMKVGGRHLWTYPDGRWTERKVAPDRWEVTFSSLKRRNSRAPKGSGAEVGSGYHWLIVAHQWVGKLDANTYATQLEGRKYLIAFRKPDWPLWNTQFRDSKRGAKERTIAALQDAIRFVEASDEGFEDAADPAALADLAAAFAAEGGARTPDPARVHAAPSRLEREAEDLAAQKLAEAEADRRAAEEERGVKGKEVKAPQARATRPRRAATSRRGTRARPRRQRRHGRQATASR